MCSAAQILPGEKSTLYITRLSRKRSPMRCSSLGALALCLLMTACGLEDPPEAVPIDGIGGRGGADSRTTARAGCPCGGATHGRHFALDAGRDQQWFVQLVSFTERRRCP